MFKMSVCFKETTQHFKGQYLSFLLGVRWEYKYQEEIRLI